MTALPSIHALRAIHEPTAQFIIKTGRFGFPNRPIYFLEFYGIIILGSYLLDKLEYVD